MPLPSISVVIPAHNEATLIRQCIESVLPQLMEHDEIIVVNNNSVDRTVAIVQQYTRVNIVHEKKQGIAYARDAGFDAAHGDIIARIDADCTVPDGWLSLIRQFYCQKSTQQTAITGLGYYQMRPQAVGKLLGAGIVLGYHIGTWFMLRKWPLFGSCMALPRAMWQQVRHDTCGDSLRVHEDIDLAVHIVRRRYAIKLLPGFFTYISSRSLVESPRKTIWRWRIWPRSVYH